MRLNRAIVFFVPALTLLALPAPAHHSRTLYDQQRVVTIEGVVTKYEWANPHIHLYVETENAAGETVVWALESGATTMMRTRGWTSDMFAPGDRVIVEGNPIREPGRPTALIASVQKIGASLFADGGAEAALDEAQSLTGTWEVPLTPFVTLFSEPSTWSLTAEGLAAIESYDDKTMNPQLECLARTAPWVMIFAGVQRIDIGDDVVSLRTEYDTVERTVHMDAPSHDGAAPTRQGHSIGRWEGDVLVVDTARFAEHRNGNARGVSSGSQKHLIERFALNPDRKSMTYRFVLEDPEYLAAPVTGELQSAYRPDLDFVPVECDLENARRFVGD